jgi:predicted RNase H-like nuclease (RuvC/YqgF family)
MENKETVEQEDSVTINDTEIKQSDLTQEQKYLASQVQEARAKRIQLQRKIDRNTAVINAFENALANTTKEVADKVLEKDKPLKEK